MNNGLSYHGISHLSKKRFDMFHFHDIELWTDKDPKQKLREEIWNYMEVCFHQLSLKGF